MKIFSSKVDEFESLWVELSDGVNVLIRFNQNFLRNVSSICNTILNLDYGNS